MIQLFNDPRVSLLVAKWCAIAGLITFAIITAGNWFDRRKEDEDSYFDVLHRSQIGSVTIVTGKTKLMGYHTTVDWNVGSGPFAVEYYKTKALAGKGHKRWCDLYEKKK